MRFKVTYEMHNKQHTQEVWAGNLVQAQQIASQMFGNCVVKVEQI